MKSMALVVVLLFFIGCNSSVQTREVSQSSQMVDVGQIAYTLVEKGETEKAINLLTSPYNESKPNALFMLGMIYDAGKGVPVNTKKASEYYLSAAKKGQPLAQLYIGWFYAEGKGVNKDTQKAIYWLRKSSKQKNTRAMGLLVPLLFLEGKQNLPEAYAWSHIAAKYDPIQSMTTARFMMKSYSSEEQIQEGKKLMIEFENSWK